MLKAIIFDKDLNKNKIVCILALLKKKKKKTASRLSSSRIYIY